MKNSFYLVIPEQKENKYLLVSYEKSAVSQWVSELPVANLSLSTRMFFNFIDGLNSLEMPVQQRLEVLEILRPLFLSIEESLRSRLIRSGFPKSKNEQKILELLLLIEKHFTIGYWSVVRELTRRDVGWFQGKNIPLAIHRTIKGLSAIVVTHYMMFLAIPDWVWIDLHSLYKLAAKSKKESNKIPDESTLLGKMSTANVSTIKDCYNQVLLLSLSDPSGLMQKEILDAYRFIGDVSQYVQIEKSAVSNQDVQCIILMDEDRSPFFDNEKGLIDVSATYFNLTKLYKVLEKGDKYINKDHARFSSMMPVKGSSRKIPLGLFQHVLRCWKGFKLEGMPFFSDRQSNYIAVGLDATHSLQGLSASVTEVLAESFSERELSCAFETEGVLSIGSLVSFRPTKKAKDRRALGIVKKMTISKSDGRIIFELAILTSKLFAVTYKNITDNLDGAEASDNDVYHKALLYGIKNESGEKSYIILDSFMHKDDDVMRMVMNDERIPIVLGDRKNIGLGYWQFECRQIEEKQFSQEVRKNSYDFI